MNYSSKLKNNLVGREITPFNIWKDGLAQTLTFIVTENCNLRCNYCYITHKSSNKKMSFDVAKKFIDYVLSEEMIRPKGVILDFIGGEPLLEIKLIDQICDYFKLKTYLLIASLVNNCSLSIGYWIQN